jgi:hypothetical protein
MRGCAHVEPDRAPRARIPTGGRVVALEHAAKSTQPAPPAVGSSTDVDHYGGRRIATELGPLFFDSFVHEHDVALVNFHAPWCPHCQAFAPVWEHAAELVLQRLADAHGTRTASSPAPPRIGLGAVDCTRPETRELCKAQHIQAFPTVRVYRGGRHHTVFDDKEHAHHESYSGARTAEAVADFAWTVAKEVQEHTGQVSGADVAPGAYTVGWQAPGTADATGAKASRVLSRGCTLEGSVRMARVPGELHIVPHGAGFSFDMAHINMTHAINHLSFGTVRAALRHVCAAARPALSARAPPSAGHSSCRRAPCTASCRGRSAARSSGCRSTRAASSPPRPCSTRPSCRSRTTWSTSTTSRRAAQPQRSAASPAASPLTPLTSPLRAPPCARCRLCPRSSSPWAAAAARRPSGYTSTPSTPLRTHWCAAARLCKDRCMRVLTWRVRPAQEPPFVVNGEKHDGPIVRLSYDVSPMQVVIEEARKPLLDSLLGMCAILGGVYTCSVMLESLLQTLHANVKKAVGKNT